MKKIISLILKGILWGISISAMVTLVIAIFTKDTSLTIPKADYIKYTLYSAVVGMGFYVPSIVYEYENISNIFKFIIHMGIGFSIFMICAFICGWIPVNYGLKAVVAVILTWAFISTVIWFLFYMYYRKEANDINKKLKSN